MGCQHTIQLQEVKNGSDHKNRLETRYMFGLILKLLFSENRFCPDLLRI